MSWNNLSFREKAAYIRTGVKNGLINIDDIKGAYNKFAEGGPENQEDDNTSPRIGYFRENGHPISYDEEGNLTDPVTNEKGVMLLPEISVIGKDYTKPYESAFNDDLKTLLLHGIPEAGSWLLGNTVGKVVDLVPGAAEGLSLITPSRWAGSIGGLAHGELIAPWSEDNEGWRSIFDLSDQYLGTNIADEYGEAADFYGDILIGPKIAKYTGKLVGKGAKDITTIRGKNTGNIRFIRNAGVLPTEVGDGMVRLSPAEQALTNLTFDQPVIRHRSWGKRGYKNTLYYDIDPKAFEGRQAMGINASDVIFENQPISKEFITVYTGDVAEAAKARAAGYKVVSTPEMQRIAKVDAERIATQEAAENGSGIQLDYNSKNISSVSDAYNEAVANAMRENNGRVTMADVKALQRNTGLKSDAVSNNFLNRLLHRQNPNIKTAPLFDKILYDEATPYEAKIAKKYGFEQHPKTGTLDYQAVVNDLGSRPLQFTPDVNLIDYVKQFRLKNFTRDINSLADEGTLFHLDFGNTKGAFSGNGAYIEENKLFPGKTHLEGQKDYTWWNKGKPYSTSVNQQPLNRAILINESDAPTVFPVRSSSEPIGQWNGKSGFVTKSEMVSSEPVDLKSATIYNRHSWPIIGDFWTPLFQDGGNLFKKGGPTYNAENKTWTNSKGQKLVVGKPYKGKYGTTVYNANGLAIFTDNNGKVTRRLGSGAKRNYIGGTTLESRQKYFDTDKELSDSVKAISNRYGIDPNTFASTLANENIIEDFIRAYNKENGPFDRNNVEGILNNPWSLSGIDFGLDDAGTHLMEGKYNMKPMVNWSTIDARNNKERDIVSVSLDNWYDYLNVMGADLEYRKKELNKRYPNLKGDKLNQAIRVAYTHGVQGASNLIDNNMLGNSYRTTVHLK